MGIFDNVIASEKKEKDDNSGHLKDFEKFEDELIENKEAANDNGEDYEKTVAMLKWINENQEPRVRHLLKILSDTTKKNDLLTERLIKSNEDIKKLHAIIDEIDNLVILLGTVTLVHGWYTVTIRDIVSQKPQLTYKTRNKRHTTSKYIKKKFKFQVFMYNTYI